MGLLILTTLLFWCAVVGAFLCGLLGIVLVAVDILKPEALILFVVLGAVAGVVLGVNAMGKPNG